MKEALLPQGGGSAACRQPHCGRAAAAAAAVVTSGMLMLVAVVKSLMGSAPQHFQPSAMTVLEAVVAEDDAAAPAPFKGQGDETWWVPLHVLLGAACCVAALGYLLAPSLDEQHKAPKLGCDEGQKFFMYAWHCDSERFRCRHCGQKVCKYHGNVNTTGIKGGHTDCAGPQCQVEPDKKEYCKQGDLYICGGCDQEFCSVHAINPPPADKPECGHRCVVHHCSSYMSETSSLVRASNQGPRMLGWTDSDFDERWTAYYAPCLALVLLCLAVMLLLPVFLLWGRMEWTKLDSSAFAIPTAPLGTLPQEVRDCGCVVILGSIVLPPVLMSAATVLIVFTLNFTAMLMKDKLGWTKRKEGQTLGDLVWQSVRVPSNLMLVPFFAIHVLHFLKLIYQSGTFEGIYANWINSGMVGFVMTGLYGSALSTVMFDTEEVGIGSTHFIVDFKKPVTFRMLVSAILLTLALPALIWYIWWALLKWFWIGIAVELLCALMMQVFFPEAAEMMAAFHRGSRHALTGKLYTPNIIVRICFGVFYFITLTLFPLAELMNVLAPRIRIKQFKSPVGPITRTLLLSIFCLVKTWEMQFLFDFEMFSLHGVGYLDAVALTYTSRHVQCSMCLLHSMFNETIADTSQLASNGAAVAMESLCQLVTYVA